jgi:hypothetical protein
VGLLATFGAGYWTARHMSKLDARRRQRSVLLALKEEVRRIREGSGPHVDGASVAVMLREGMVVPEIHPWIQAIISESAESNPAIVGGFMRLDNVLYNLRAQGDPHMEAFKALGEASSEVERLQTEAKKKPSTTMPAEMAEFLSGELMAKQHATVAGDNLRRVETQIETIHGLLHKELNRLEQLLDQAAKA